MGEFNKCLSNLVIAHMDGRIQQVLRTNHLTSKGGGLSNSSYGWDNSTSAKGQPFDIQGGGDLVIQSRYHC